MSVDSSTVEAMGGIGAAMRQAAMEKGQQRLDSITERTRVVSESVSRVKDRVGSLWSSAKERAGSAVRGVLGAGAAAEVLGDYVAGKAVDWAERTSTRWGEVARDAKDTIIANVQESADNTAARINEAYTQLTEAGRRGVTLASEAMTALSEATEQAVDTLKSRMESGVASLKEKLIAKQQALKQKALSLGVRMVAAGLKPAAALESGYARLYAAPAVLAEMGMGAIDSRIGSVSAILDRLQQERSVAETDYQQAASELRTEAGLPPGEALMVKFGGLEAMTPEQYRQAKEFLRLEGRRMSAEGRTQTKVEGCQVTLTGLSELRAKLAVRAETIRQQAESKRTIRDAVAALKSVAAA